MTTTVAYCTPEDVRTKNRLDITTADDDGTLAQIIDAVSHRIDEMQNVPIGGYKVTTDTTRYYQYSDIGKCGRLFLDAPCLSVTTLTNGDSTTIPSSGYRLHPRNESQKMFIQLLSSYSWGFTTDGEISVVGKFGYSTEPPPTIVEATALWSGHILKRYQAALQDATVNVELGQLIYSAPVPSLVVSLLRPVGAML